jgi:hypothetical protein
MGDSPVAWSGGNPRRLPSIRCRQCPRQTCRQSQGRKARCDQNQQRADARAVDYKASLRLASLPSLPFPLPISTTTRLFRLSVFAFCFPFLVHLNRVQSTLVPYVVKRKNHTILAHDHSNNGKAISVDSTLTCAIVLPVKQDQTKEKP